MLLIITLELGIGIGIVYETDIAYYYSDFIRQGIEHRETPMLSQKMG